MGLKRGLKETLREQGYPNLKRKLGYSITVLIIALIIWTIVVFFYAPKECGTEDCLNKAMKNCERVFYKRGSPEATWLYEIKGGNDYCNVEVKLLKIKKGSIDIESLQGKKMECEIRKGSTNYPEEDISQCHGLLKENLQEILIERMHDYLLENMGEIKGEFEGV